MKAPPDKTPRSTRVTAPALQRPDLQMDPTGIFVSKDRTDSFGFA